jgi:soluble lytic murein transglycosylase-like protein
MRNLRGTYVHRGDQARRRRKLGKVLIVACFLTATGFVWAGRNSSTAIAEPAWAAQSDGLFLTRAEGRRLRWELENARGELDLLRGQYERAERILHFSRLYDISAGLATSIFDTSLREGIDPELAFRLVRLESEFNPRAVSSAGALGLTQLMPTTATRFEKGLTRDQIFDSATNLRIGFRYLRDLLGMFKGDVRLALLAYNRGEAAVFRDLKAGVDPGNGYDRLVITGYSGKGIID